MVDLLNTVSDTAPILVVCLSYFPAFHSALSVRDIIVASLKISEAAAKWDYGP